ncbi:hypothetical protein KAT73_05075 [candidate division WOR-3 bacterium]|nr:hypothetical protein [candidate division WOR-3 bacterium]
MIIYLLIISLIGAEFNESVPLKKGYTGAVIEIDLSGFKFSIKEGNSNSIISTYISYNKERILPNIEYEWEENVCKVKLFTEEKETTMFGEDSAVVYLSPNIPLSLQIHTSSQSKIDLTHLMIDDLNIIIGLGYTWLYIKEPNPINCKRIRIFGNIGKLSAEGIGYLNFDDLHLELNAGMVNLDMSGNYDGRSNVEIKSGIAVLNMTLPSTTGVKLKTNGILHTSTEQLIRKDNWYTSSNFGQTAGELVIHVHSGLGKLNVRYENKK